jgi:hypothetical protein
MANWSVSPYHKKSCAEHEYYFKDGMAIIRKTGFRGATFYVETTDDNPPELEYDEDSIDMYNCVINNIENVELDSMWDGCWEDIEWPDQLPTEERERIQALIDETGDIYDVLENQEGWNQNETEAWIWGPILIEDSDGNQVRIICAGEDGQAIDYQEE